MFADDFGGDWLVTMLMSRQRFDQAFEQRHAVGAAEQRIETRSGCGIRPSTLRFSFRMPAMLRAEPLGLSPVRIAERDAAFAFEAVERVVVGEIIAFAMRHRETHALALVIARVKARLCFLDTSSTGRQTNFRSALRISAPGSRPVSVRT